MNDYDYHIKQIKKIIVGHDSANYDLKELALEKIIHTQALLEALQKLRESENE